MRSLYPLLVMVIACSSPPAPAPDAGMACARTVDFDLSSCPTATLASVPRAGIWNARLDVPSGLPGYASFSLLGPDAEVLAGRPVTTKELAGDRFFLSVDYERRGRPNRFSIAACSAEAPDRIAGRFARCVDGVTIAEGTFVAHRLARRAGEGEAKGLSLISEVDLPEGNAADVFVSGGYAYVPAFTSGLFIFDVRDPARPRLAARLEATDDYWNAASVRGNVLYVASEARGLVWFDVTDPASPKPLGSAPAEPVDVHSVFVEGERLYAVSPGPTGEVLVFDISQPTAPQLKARIKARDANPEEGAWPHDAFATPTRLYVNHWFLGLVVFDVSDLTNVRELGRFTYPNATTHASAVGTFGNRVIAFVGDENWGAHLRVLDVTDPAKISPLAEYRTRDEVSIHNLHLSGTRLYVAYYQDGVRVLDVSDPARPVEAAYFNTWRETDVGRGRAFFEGAIGVRAEGGRIYVAETERGLLVLEER